MYDNILHEFIQIAVFREMKLIFVYLIQGKLGQFMQNKFNKIIWFSELFLFKYQRFTPTGFICNLTD